MFKPKNKSKCPKCGSGFYNGKKCGDCDFILPNRESSSSLTSACQCGNRGLDISLDGGYPIYECYWCHQKKQSDKFRCAEKTKFSNSQMAYYAAIEKYFLIPAYYGDKPNFDEISKAADAMSGVKKVVLG